MTVFIRLLDSPGDEKAGVLRDVLHALARSHKPGEIRPALKAGLFRQDPSGFAAVPGSPFAYWLSASLRRIFVALPAFSADGRTAVMGLQSSDDFRFVRTWWEVPCGTLGVRWYCLAKGGAFSPSYADVPLVVDWLRSGAQTRAIYAARRDVIGGIIKNPSFYGRPGLTWPVRTNGLSFRVMPTGCIFSHKGPAAFLENDPPGELLALSAVLNSAPFGYLVGAQLARTELAQSYEVGLIQRTPVPELGGTALAALAKVAFRAWSLMRSLDTTNETSHAFVLPTGPNERVSGLDPAAIERELEQIQREIDDRAFDLYGIGPEDRAIIEASSKQASKTDPNDDDSEEDDDDDAPVSGVAIDTLLSWFVGVAFGRFDLRLATGERPVPPEPEPFDPLPRRSPGMWPEGETPPVAPPDVLVDDPGHRLDLRSHVVSLMARLATTEPSDLRGWLAKDFFPLHLKMYSKSRRKAPIYWQLGVPSGRYSVWLYAHRATRDTLYAVQDLVKDKLLHEERALADTVQSAGPHPTAGQRKDLEARETLVEELRAFREEVARVAPLWRPDLDDGVVLTKAPLWRLVPQHRAWQKELRSYWDGLCEGKYDWAHVAMHLWPERVVPKCAQDRSLAIAHDLEEVFWVENDKGKWAPRKEPTRPLADLIEERTSPAVKSALASLMAAPTATGAPTKRGRKAKKNA